MLHHVSLEVREAAADEEVAFWALLGFDEVAPPAALAGTSRWVQDAASAQQIHLLFEDRPTVPHGAHVAIVRPQYDAQLAALRAAGLEVLVRREYWGAPRSFVRSPGGHRVEVMQAPPAS
jgi:catechol 2,3-dioxygenase-like lactoylglutathione lyase family enzyme